VKTVWRRAMRSSDVQARLLSMYGDARVEWQLVRDAQRYQESVLDPLSAPVPRWQQMGQEGGQASKTPRFLMGASLDIL
jgi:hypothetical protein